MSLHNKLEIIWHYHILPRGDIKFNDRLKLISSKAQDKSRHSWTLILGFLDSFYGPKYFIEYEFMESFRINMLMRTHILKVYLQMKQCVWFCFPISSFLNFSFDISWRHPLRIIEQKQNIVYLDQVDCLSEQTVVAFRDRLLGCQYMVCLIAARLSIT